MLKAAPWDDINFRFQILKNISYYYFYETA